jgi:hypothetical protein
MDRVFALMAESIHSGRIRTGDALWQDRIELELKLVGFEQAERVSATGPAGAPPGTE